jgi:hypothetical protein
MNIIILLCFVIFITYLLICCILAYYFLKHRNIWNKTFDSFNILNYFECPIHSIFWIPIKDKENSIENSSDNSFSCLQCKQEEIDNQIYLQELQTLSSVYKLFKEIDKTYICQYENEVKNKVNLYDMFNWLLKGSIRDYEIIKDERAEVYYKLKETYEKTQVISLSLSNHSSNTENNIPLENISYIENNIELCNKIININDIYKKNIIDTKSQYLFALFNDIDEYIKQINIKFNNIFY